MTSQTFLSELFRIQPHQWGLRGDPHLWTEMSVRFDLVRLPTSEAQLAALIEETFLLLTGHPISHPDPIFVERYSHGGMSSGHVSPDFWRETALPLLCGRLRSSFT